jgi:predicted transcriptional regulator
MSDESATIVSGGKPMDDPLVMVSVRIPKSVAERATRLAKAQDRTLQAVYSRALRFGMDLEEERDRIACEAIKAAEGRRRAQQPGGTG